jgi:hypothetical protein
MCDLKKAVAVADKLRRGVLSAKLTKKRFLSLPIGSHLLLNCLPFRCIVVAPDREVQWKEIREDMGQRLTHSFTSKADMEQFRREMVALWMKNGR